MNNLIVLMIIRNLKPVNNLEKEYFFTNLKNDYPDDEEI